LFRAKDYQIMIYPFIRIHSLCCLLGMMVILIACNQKVEKQTGAVTDTIPKKDQTLRGYFSDQEVIRTDSGQLKNFFIKYPLLNNYKNDVYQFYGYRQFHYAWFDDSGLSEQAGNLYNHLNNLELEGVQAAVPYKQILDSLFNDPSGIKKSDPDLEILLSAEYFFYAEKVWKGIPEENTNKLAWFLPRKKLNLPYMTDSLLKESSASLFSDNYSIRQYNLLKGQLRKYRQLDSVGKWETLQPEAQSLKKQDSSEMIRKLRHRLFLLGDLKDDSGNSQFDEGLEVGIKSFQERNGMLPDGVAGSGFFREINIPPQETIRKLIINMERTRWLPIVRSSHYIIINIPSFTLSAYDKDTVSFTMNVVVGKDMHQTVVFNGDIKYVVFSPYWNVPPSILKKEILPAIKKNPNYLSKNNMEWNGNGVRQKPGPSNALGLVKFLFPNSFNIYLHDSPAKSLFGAQTRAFSHGCIRLAEPKKLAIYLLKDDPQWTKEKIEKAMHAGKEKYVTLKNPVPVFIGYLTAWVDLHGRLNLRKDIYKRDLPLAEMLFQQ
jgi:L,D-transpeptidase YcbB